MAGLTGYLKRAATAKNEARLLDGLLGRGKSGGRKRRTRVSYTKKRSFYSKGAGKKVAKGCRGLTKRLSHFTMRPVQNAAGDFRKVPKHGWGQIRSFFTTAIPGAEAGYAYFQINTKGIAGALQAYKRLQAAGKSHIVIYNSDADELKAKGLFAVKAATDAAKAQIAAAAQNAMVVVG